MMWEVCAAKSEALGATVKMDAEVTRLHFENNEWTVELKNSSRFSGFDYVISSAPLKQLIPFVSPALPGQVISAALNLQYRDFITVILILKDRHIFTDNWIYIHDPSVKVGRIQNFKSWSPDMVPDPDMSCYGLEYFCFDGDGLWNMTDEQLIELGKDEIAQIGIAGSDEITDGYVVRQKKAYPVYDHAYKQNVNIIKDGLKQCPGLYLVGRNGMHKYNNQDHSMMTAMLAAKNILAGEELYDLWQVNEDAEYHETYETGVKGAGRQVPQALNRA
jgi:protoporphyrinogen oxidase